MPPFINKRDILFMRKFYLSVFFLLLPVSFLQFNCSPALMNLDDSKQAIQDYYEKGDYEKELTEQINDAINDLEGIKPAEKSAVIFDIDETSLSSYEHIKSVGFGYVPQMWSDWMLSAKQKAIPQTKKLYDKVIQKGFRVIFLTGRNEKYYESSYKNLIAEGYTKFDTLITRKQGEHHTTAVEFKGKVRAELVKNGYNIVMNVGDQYSDLLGGNSGIEVKLPDYLYFVP